MRPFHRTYPAKAAPLPRKAVTCSCRGLVSINRRAPAAMSERGERGWAKLYLTRRVKGRSLARARVPDYNARTWFLIRRRMSVVGFAEMCIASCCIEEVYARWFIALSRDAKVAAWFTIPRNLLENLPRRK